MCVGGYSAYKYAYATECVPCPGSQKRVSGPGTGVVIVGCPVSAQTKKTLPVLLATEAYGQPRPGFLGLFLNEISTRCVAF